MPLLLRTIRKARWYQVSWLPESESQADALLDLTTLDNKLSVWHIEDNRSNLNRVVAALAAKRENIVNLDYVLFDLQAILDMNISLHSTKGDVPDDEVSNSWHRDLSDLSAKSIVDIARTLQKNGERVRKHHGEVKELIKEAVEYERVSNAKLKPSVQAKIR